MEAERRRKEVAIKPIKWTDSNRFSKLLKNWLKGEAKTLKSVKATSLTDSLNGSTIINIELILVGLPVFDTPYQSLDVSTCKQVVSVLLSGDDNFQLQVISHVMDYFFIVLNEGLKWTLLRWSKREICNM